MHTHKQRRIVAFILFWLTATSALANIPLSLNKSGLPTLSPLLQEVTPAVVNISVMSKVPVTENPLFNDPFFRRFFDIPEQAPVQPRMSAGSGVIVDADKGYVLTNHHVVDGADEIRITLTDRRTFEAQRLGSDAATDIALLQIKADDLTALELVTPISWRSVISWWQSVTRLGWGRPSPPES